MQQLFQQLNNIDQKGYKAYKGIQGKYTHADFGLWIDYVQGDPFASPSRIRIVIPGNRRPLQSEWLTNPSRLIATEDRIARAVGKEVAANQVPVKGSGKSRSEEHTSELQSRGHLVCRLLLEKKKTQ